jgi:hypothetical protein
MRARRRASKPANLLSRLYFLDGIEQPGRNTAHRSAPMTVSDARSVWVEGGRGGSIFDACSSPECKLCRRKYGPQPGICTHMD